jgi:hypothetical protein
MVWDVLFAARLLGALSTQWTLARMNDNSKHSALLLCQN